MNPVSALDDEISANLEFHMEDHRAQHEGASFPGLDRGYSVSLYRDNSAGVSGDEPGDMPGGESGDHRFVAASLALAIGPDHAQALASARAGDAEAQQRVT